MAGVYRNQLRNLEVEFGLPTGVQGGQSAVLQSYAGGTGHSLYRDMDLLVGSVSTVNGVEESSLKKKTLVAGPNMSIVSTENTITLDVDTGGGGVISDVTASAPLNVSTTAPGIVQVNVDPPINQGSILMGTSANGDWSTNGVISGGPVTAGKLGISVSPGTLAELIVSLSPSITYGTWTMTNTGTYAVADTAITAESVVVVTPGSLVGVTMAASTWFCVTLAPGVGFSITLQNTTGATTPFTTGTASTVSGSYIAVHA